MNNDPAPTYQTVTQPGRVSVLEAECPQFKSAPSDQYTLSAERTFTIQSVDFIPGDFVVCAAGGKEMLRLAGNGDIYVRGELMETNRDVVDGLKRMLGVDVKPSIPNEYQTAPYTCYSCRNG